jgi:hypothetical protein
MVGLVRWCWNHQDFKENLSGGVGLVCVNCGKSERTVQFRKALAHQCCTTSRFSEGQSSWRYPHVERWSSEGWASNFPTRFSLDYVV